ncbi:glycosyltransferase [Parabacteroides johnsonii]|nr:glycosyltransferase [Parabacteroides johnsonii]
MFECEFTSGLFVSCIRKRKKIFEVNVMGYKSIKLPDCKRFNTSKNKEILLKYIKDNSIDCIFNLMHTSIDLIHFLKFIRVNSECKILNIIHNRPDLVVFNKKQCLLNSNIGDLKTLKEKVQKVTYPLYIKLLYFYIKKINTISYELHDGIVLLSASYISIYKKMIDKDAQNIYAIPNPIPNISSKVSIDCKKNEIIFVGHLTKVKAVDRLLSIWHKVQEKNKEWSLLIVGDGPERAYLESIVKNNNLERVQFVGRVKSIDYIDSAKILCLVSNFEGLPTVFLEAMRLGVVPVGYDTFPAIYDIIDDKKNGFIIPFEDEPHYVKTLFSIMNDDLFRQDLARRAKLKSKKFSVESIAKKWIDVFVSLDLLSKSNN